MTLLNAADLPPIDPHGADVTLGRWVASKNAEQAFVIAVTVHRVLARHGPHERCEECPRWAVKR